VGSSRLAVAPGPARLLLVLLGAGAASLKTPSSDSFTIPGVQAQQASDLLTARFPAVSANGAQGLIVFEGPKAGTVTSASSRAAIESTLDALKKQDALRAAPAPARDAGMAVVIGGTAIAAASAFVPAVMSLLGRSAWWLPRWLARVLPTPDSTSELPAGMMAGLLYDMAHATLAATGEPPSAGASMPSPGGAA
jgi:hypothetical protein